MNDSTMKLVAKSLFGYSKNATNPVKSYSGYLETKKNSRKKIVQNIAEDLKLSKVKIEDTLGMPEVKSPVKMRVKDYATVNVCFSFEELEKMTNSQRYYYFRGHKQVCPSCGKNKTLMTFNDVETLENFEICGTCRKKQELKIEKAKILALAELIVSEMDQN